MHNRRSAMYYLSHPQGDPDDSCWLRTRRLAHGSFITFMRMACCTFGYGQVDDVLIRLNGRGLALHLPMQAADDDAAIGTRRQQSYVASVAQWRRRNKAPRFITCTACLDILRGHMRQEID